MPKGPRKADIPSIRRTLAVYRVSSLITGVFLLLLCLMMVLRYGFGVDIHAFGSEGPLVLTPKELITDGVNLSIVLLGVHGWLYVLYLACDFLLWRMMRWPFSRFLLVALGGVVPFLSFVLERRVPHEIEPQLAALEAPGPRGADTVEARP